jgi:hypothetical protein
MTHLAINPTETENTRELRTTVRLPDQTASRLFQGWGPKF